MDATVHVADIRENDAQANGTVWATDNPGFAGTGFRFNDELFFDVTGPLRRWDGSTWASSIVGSERMEFVEPGPFGDHLNAVSIRKDASFGEGYRIAQIGTRGSLHTHFVFILHTTNGVSPAVGAYSFPLTLRSPQYVSAPPVHLVFNNGLAESEFARAVTGFQIRLESRTEVFRTGQSALALRVSTFEGIRYQPQSSSAVGGPWTDWGAAFVGDGGSRDLPIEPQGEAGFFRVLQEP